MKFWNRIISLAILVVLSLGLWTLPAAASAMEHDGLVVTVTTDKDYYEPGEEITATLTVENTNNHNVTIVSLEQLIPEGYKLTNSSQSALSNVQLGAKQTMSLEVTFVGEPTQEGIEEAEMSFIDKLIYGKTLGIPNLLLLVIAVIAVVIFFVLT